MQTQFKYITDLAKQYKEYFENSDSLFKAVNSLAKNEIENIFNEYGDPESDFKPVNLLRAEVARRLMIGDSVTEKLINEIKDKIRKKDIAYFDYYKTGFLKQLEEYELFNRDIFANWKNEWRIFYSFFYRGTIKETVQAYLEQIANDLLLQLELSDYTFHKVDFQGASNFGSDFCWIALYPIIKESHKDSYQFFLRLGAVSEAGRMAGYSINEPNTDQLKLVTSYSEVVSNLKLLKTEIVQLNNESRNYFKFAPGSQASEWKRFYDENIIAIDFGFEDLNKFNSREKMNLSIGLSSDNKSNKTLNLWLFKTANKGDVVFATKGVNICLGIGIIQGDYYYDHTATSFNHRRAVIWITDKVYQYKAGTLKNYKNLFRPDTFSPTNVSEFILNEYIRIYPELTSIFEENNLKHNYKKVGPTISPETEVGLENVTDEIEPLCFWWLNANPNIWSISNHAEGEFQTYTTHNEKGNKRRIYKYFEAVKPGDLIIGYESSPTKQIKAIYEITKGIHVVGNEEKIEFELIEKLEIPVHWNDLKNNPTCKPTTNCILFRSILQQVD